MCAILPAAHDVTGCDTTSAFVGIGKRSVYKVLKDRPEEFEDLTSLAGRDDNAAISAGRKLISALYDPKSRAKRAHRNLNELRVKLASQKNLSLLKLPPSEASFIQHMKSCLFVGV